MGGEAKGDDSINVGDLFKLLQSYRISSSLWEKGATKDQNCSSVFPASLQACVCECAYTLHVLALSDTDTAQRGLAGKREVL